MLHEDHSWPTHQLQPPAPVLLHLASERLSTPDSLLETPSTVLPCFPFPVRNTSPLHSTLPTWRRCLPTARKGYLTSTPYHHLEAAEEQRAIDMQYMFNYGPQKKKKKKEKKSVLSCRVWWFPWCNHPDNGGFHATKTSCQRGAGRRGAQWSVSKASSSTSARRVNIRWVRSSLLVSHLKISTKRLGDGAAAPRLGGACRPQGKAGRCVTSGLGRALLCSVCMHSSHHGWLEAAENNVPNTEWGKDANSQCSQARRRQGQRSESGSPIPISRSAWRTPGTARGAGAGRGRSQPRGTCTGPPLCCVEVPTLVRPGCVSRSLGSAGASKQWMCSNWLQGISASSYKSTVLLGHLPSYLLGFPDGASGKGPNCQCRRYKRCGCNP